MLSLSHFIKHWFSLPPLFEKGTALIVTKFYKEKGRDYPDDYSVKDRKYLNHERFNILADRSIEVLDF